MCVWRCILTVTALISLSWPGNVCLHWPSRMSHSLADASHAPDTNALQCGDSDRAITSPVCPMNEVTCWPVSMSHRPHDMSPELVTICVCTDKMLTNAEEGGVKKKPCYYTGKEKPRNTRRDSNNKNNNNCLIVIQKATARQVAGMSGQFT